ncbi:DNA methyltransferase [Staphylococcus aureus]|nr:DNA methyltransferase [Staphylococcus aureus]MDN8797244.1 DNA methyltransferase [Staphylococcus aureus]
MQQNQVFGEENDLGTITVVNNMKGRSDSKFFATSSEFMQVYAKQSSQCIINGLPVSEDYIKEFKFKDTIGRYKHVALKKTGKNSLRSDRPNLYYPIYYNPKTNHSSLDKLSDEYIEILPIHSNGTDGRWSWGKDTFLSKKDSELDFKMNSKKQYMPYIKMRLGEGDDIRTVRPKTAWIGPEYSTSNSANMIKDILGNKDIFETAKPLQHIVDVIRVATPNKNAKVLDFFAGSGTTGHAVLELNKEDGGHRQFILCTNNENNICRDVTYERLRRVINGYTTPKGKEIERLPANLMYLTVGETPKENNDVMFDMDENEPLRPHIINNLRLKYHLHHPDELVENLYRLRNGNTVHYVYFNDYIEDGVEEAILESLDRDKTNIMHTVEGLVHDETFSMMDDVKDIAGLLNE